MFRLSKPRSSSVAFCVLLFCTANARPQVHLPEPTVNLGDTSFLDATGGPGLLVAEIGDECHSGDSAGLSGHLAGAYASLTP